MKRPTIVALLLLLVVGQAVHGQAKLLPPIDKPMEEPKQVEHLQSMPLPPRGATMGPPTSLPPLVPITPEVPQHGPPHQMYGREPAHGTKTAGIPKGPTKAPVILTPALPMPEVCPPVGRCWAEVDYLIWWVQGDQLPALLTTSPSGTPQGQAGVLGQPSTSVLAGGGPFNESGRSGIRFAVGYWLDPLQRIGIQAGGFWLENGTARALFVSPGDPNLARPFLDVNTALASSELIAFPGFSSGSAVVSAHSSLNGWDIAFRQNGSCFCNGRIDALVGYRQLRLTDQLGLTADVTSQAAIGPRGLPAGAQYVAIDRFDTENQFYGAEFGIVGEVRLRQWVVEGLAKVAAGWNVSHININGATLVTLPAGPTVTNGGGFLALPSNIGHYRKSDPTLIPEFGVNVGYDVNCHLRLRGGYSFLYWDQVYRPGQQIDLGINPNLLPPGAGGGPARPLALREETDIFVHGLNFGVEVRY